jgi:ATP/maltotriose-dependent transcriptional regulator MalT
MPVPLLSTKLYINQRMGLNLSSADVAALEARTEGWIAGLQLAAISMQGRADITGFVKAFTGSHVFVAEYLIEEVLSRQVEAVQSFLLQTSILERMNASLCEAVTERQNGQGVLDSLRRLNLPLFFDGSPLVGLGLENSGPGFIFMTVLDLVLLAGGMAVYQISRKRMVAKASA